MKTLWIAGGWQDSHGSRVRRVENPATPELVDEVFDATADDVRRACAAAAKAQRQWRKVPALERGKLLHETAALMRTDRARLSELLTREGGKPRIENLDEVEWCAACFDYYAELARSSQGMSIPPMAEHQINFTIKEPLGVVAAIVPFNYPLLLLVWKIAPALAAGNGVVIKRSELTPLGDFASRREGPGSSATRRRQRRHRGGRGRVGAGRRPGCGVHRVHGVDRRWDADRRPRGRAVEARQPGARRHPIR